MGDSFGVNPVLSGLMQAFSMANVMKHQRMQQEQLQLQKNRDQRQQEHEKFAEGRQTSSDLQSALLNGAKPVDPQGNFSRQDSIDFGPNLPASQFNVQVPADPGRVTKIGGQSFQLPTQQETNDTAFAQRQRQFDAEQSVRSRNSMEETAAKLKAEGAARRVTLPGIGDIDRSAVPFFTEQTRAKTQKETNANTRTSAEKIASEANASRERAAGIRATAAGSRGLTANGQGIADRAATKEADADTATVQKSQADEQKLWGEMSQIQNQLESKKVLGGTPATANQEFDLNPLKEAQLRQQMITKRKQIDVLQKTQRQLIEKHGGKYSNGAGTPAGGTAENDPLGIR